MAFDDGIWNLFSGDISDTNNGKEDDISFLAFKDSFSIFCL
jgi:hypothetical protein